MVRQGRDPACKEPLNGCYQPLLLELGPVGDILSKVINWTNNLIVAHHDMCCERSEQDIMIENNAWEPFWGGDVEARTESKEEPALQRRGENIPSRGNSMCKGLDVCPRWGVKERGIFKAQREDCSLLQLEPWVRARVARTRMGGCVPAYAGSFKARQGAWIFFEMKCKVI